MSLEKIYDSLGDADQLDYNGDRVLRLSSHIKNPILDPRKYGIGYPSDNYYVGSVFNGGAVLHKDQVYMLPRIHEDYIRKSYIDVKTGLRRFYMENYVSRIGLFRSIDGVDFELIDKGVLGPEDPGGKDFRYGLEDIRVTPFKDRYYLIGCGKIKPPFQPGGDRVAIYSTADFQSFEYHGIIDVFDGRNALLFPEEIDNKVYMVLRFHPNIHIAMLREGIEQLTHPQKYRVEWMEIYRDRGRNILIEAGETKYEWEKVGGGPPPIKTDEGWLLIYHAVGTIDKKLAGLYGLRGEIPRGYSVFAALLDPNNPTQVRYRSRYPIYIPHKPWEYEGNEDYPVDIPYVVFPVGAITYKEKLLIYSGAGDKYMVLLTCNLDTLIDYLIKYGKRPHPN